MLDSIGYIGLKNRSCSKNTKIQKWKKDEHWKCRKDTLLVKNVPWTLANTGKCSLFEKSIVFIFVGVSYHCLNSWDLHAKKLKIE